MDLNKVDDVPMQHLKRDEKWDFGKGSSTTAVTFKGPKYWSTSADYIPAPYSCIPEP